MHFWLKHHAPLGASTMKSIYFENDDILQILVSEKQIVREVSQDWHTNISMPKTARLWRSFCLMRRRKACCLWNTGKPLDRSRAVLNSNFNWNLTPILPLASTTASSCTQNWATCHPMLSSVNRHQTNLSNCPKLLDRYSLQELHPVNAVVTIHLLPVSIRVVRHFACRVSRRLF